MFSSIPHTTSCKWLFFLLLSVLLTNCHKTRSSLLIEDGTIDFSSRNFAENHPYSIKGKGLFYWKQLLKITKVFTSVIPKLSRDILDKIKF